FNQLVDICLAIVVTVPDADGVRGRGFTGNGEAAGELRAIAGFVGGHSGDDPSCSDTGLQQRAEPGLAVLVGRHVSCTEERFALAESRRIAPVRCEESDLIRSVRPAGERPFDGETTTSCRGPRQQRVILQVVRAGVSVARVIRRDAFAWSRSTR